MTMFKSDVQSVRLFRRYSYEMLLLLDDCSVFATVDQSGTINKSVVLSNGQCHQSGNDTLALTKCPRSRSQPVIRTICLMPSQLDQ